MFCFYIVYQSKGVNIIALILDHEENKKYLYVQSMKKENEVRN